MANQKRCPITIGFLPLSPGSETSTLALNAANTWLAMGFTPSETGRTLNGIKLYQSAINGTQANIAGTCNLYPDTNGVPGAAAIETITISAGSWPAASNWVEFTGFTTALTSGTHYWIVWKNTSAAPTVDYPTFRWGAANTGPIGTCGHVTNRWGKVHTLDGGTAWATLPQPNVCGMRVQYSDAYDGFPVSNVASCLAANRIYSNHERGAYFVSPTGMTINVRGIVMWMDRFGTPTVNLCFKLYTGETPTLIATTASVAVATVSTTENYIESYFSETHAITQGTVVRITASGDASNSDTNSNAYSVKEYTTDNAVASKALMPFGSFKACNFNGSTWDAEDDTICVPCALILDTEGEFTAAGGGESTYVFS